MRIVAASIILAGLIGSVAQAQTIFEISDVAFHTQQTQNRNIESEELGESENLGLMIIDDETVDDCDKKPCRKKFIGTVGHLLQFNNLNDHIWTSSKRNSYQFSSESLFTRVGLHLLTDSQREYLRAKCGPPHACRAIWELVKSRSQCEECDASLSGMRPGRPFYRAAEKRGNAKR